MSSTIVDWLFGGWSLGRSLDETNPGRVRTARPDDREIGAGAAKTDDDHLDDRLVAQVRSGDIVAFERLFRQYHVPLVKFATSYLGSIDDAEEVVATVFARVWAHRATWTTTAGVSAYLFGAVRNRALNVIDRWTRDQRRRAGFQELGETPGIAMPSPGPVEQMELDDRVAAVRRLVAKLSERRRLILALRWTHGLTWDEIAAVLGVTRAAVQREHSRILASLRADLPAS